MIQQGTIINNRYELKEFKGSGTFGEVWLAQDTRTGIDVALKIYIALNDDNATEFLKEYQTAYGLRHTNLLTTDYFDIWERRPFLIMKYCPNGSLASRVQHMSERDMWTFLRDVASGLEYLHSQQPDPIVHQDIKPDNILVDEQGRYLITDFGISKRIRSSLRKMSTTNTTAGSMPYMAPERFSAEPTPVKASDIWSLGATIYELATGELPFSGMGGGMQAGGAERPNLPSEYSASLNDTMRACLAKETWDRPQAAQLRQLAQAILDGNKPEASWLDKTPKETQPQQQQPQPEQPKPTPDTGKDKSYSGVIWTLIVLFVFALGLTLVHKYQQEQEEKYRRVQQELQEEQEARRKQQEQEEQEALRKQQEQEALQKQKEQEARRKQQEQEEQEALRKQQEQEALQKQKEQEAARKKQQQQKYNGHKYVDLGLSVKWATCNIGASKPEDYGDYFAWGEDETKSEYTENNSATFRKTNYTFRDAAKKKWGGTWRMPTADEFQELVDNCTWTWTTQGGHDGYKVTSKKNGNSIFLPAAGYRYGSSLGNAWTDGRYWSSTPNASNSNDAYILDFISSSHYVGNYNRYYGRSVRPVSE